MTHVTAGMAWNLLGLVVNYTLISLIAAATTTLITPLIVLVPLVLGLTMSLVGTIPILAYLPDLAGIQLLTEYPGTGLLGPIDGGLITGTRTLVLVTTGWMAFRRQDA